MTIDVTQKNIDEGAVFTGTNCAIARALKDTFGASEVFVGYDRGTPGLIVQINDASYVLDGAGVQFVLSFDAGKKVTPTRLTLTPYVGAYSFTPLMLASPVVR